MKKNIFIFLGALAFNASAFLLAAPIDVRIDRTGKANLGFSDFVGEGKNTTAGVTESIQNTVSQDLDFSKIFNLIKNGPIIRKKQDAHDWASIGTEIVLGATVEMDPKNNLQVTAKLYDTGSNKELVVINEKRPASQSRGLAHEVSNQIVLYFTGQKGIFGSRIAYVNDVTGRKELYVSDYDGKNSKKLTNDNSIVILPRVSPDGKKIIFTSYIGGNPDLYIMNSDGSGRKKISSKAGLNVSPSWSPTNQSFALTLSQNGPPNIFLMDLDGGVLQRLTDSREADTAPTFSPDGNQFAFTSDRDGAPHIYIMNMDGTGLRRVTTESHCDSAAWSPDGQTLVYVKGAANHFDIYSVEVLTGIERRLTWGEGDNENPTWSPDGRFIAFISTRRKKNELFIMSVDGTDQRPLFTNNGQSFTPHWSN